MNLSRADIREGLWLWIDSQPGDDPTALLDDFLTARVALDDFLDLKITPDEYLDIIDGCGVDMDDYAQLTQDNLGFLGF